MYQNVNIFLINKNQALFLLGQKKISLKIQNIQSLSLIKAVIFIISLLNKQKKNCKKTETNLHVILMSFITKAI